MNVPYRSTGNLAVEEVNRYRLFDQPTGITERKGSLVNDDRLDALALGVHYWTEQMARDAKREENKYRDETMDKDLKEFMKRGYLRTHA